MRTQITERWNDHLAQPDWLEEHLNDPAIRIVDMRGDVQTTTVEQGVQKAVYHGRQEAYAAGHIPGAVYIDWTQDIIDPESTVPVQIADPERFARAMEVRGISNDTLVIAYDDHPASQFATRLWWALCYYGHERVKVLDGGWARWTQEGRRVRYDTPAYPRGSLQPHLQPSWRTTVEGMLGALYRPDVLLVDARDEDQYSGKVRRGPRGGHIPGAVHLPRERLFNSEGRLLPPEELRQAIEAAGISPSHPVIAYCNGGVAATSVLFALDILGFPNLSNYDGSWNEWSERREMPVE